MNKILHSDLTNDFNYTFSALAGYKCTFDDIIYFYGKLYMVLIQNDENAPRYIAECCKGFSIPSRY